MGLKRTSETKILWGGAHGVIPISDEFVRGFETMVRLAGIEPATCGFEVRRSILLSYRRVLKEEK